MDAETLCRIIEDADLELRRSYSGRGMSGRSCVGFVTDESVMAALSSIIACCDNIEQASDLVSAARTDNMGRGTIVYWPRIRDESEPA